MSESEANKLLPEIQKCPQCGTPLPAGALGGLCPACLLKQGASGDTAAQSATSSFVPPPVAEIAKLFPQLEIIRLLGKGGMGAVYLARQPSLDRLVALKILPPQSDSGSGFGERFIREARALARLSHPNIVTVYEFGVAGNLHFFLMEYVDGMNLRQLQLSGRLSPREALQIVPQLCDALQFAHDEGVVHRDIKPENVLMDQKGRVKIADFGLAKMLGHETGNMRLTGEGHVMGTPHYMSPEQVEHPLDVDHRADIYSLGVVFYEMLTGELPLGRFAPPSSKVMIDVRLDDVVMRALEKEPNRRYQHASQVRTAVDTITSSAAPPPAANAENLAREILARGYALNIGSCVSRGWALVKGDFFPIVGLTALMLILLAIAGSLGSTMVSTSGNRTVSISSVFGILVWGPLVGGLFLHYLKKIRREVTGVDTAFSGFTKRFLHLFLGGFVAWMLTIIGYLFLIIPGIYLMVVWIFALPLIIDKQIDFWPAMELSRKVVTRHWWKFLGFCLVLDLLVLAGVLACGIGVFVTMPIAIAALMYAYEDILGEARQTLRLPLGGVGPSGTMAMPNTPIKPANAPVGSPKVSLAFACALIFFGGAVQAEDLPSTPTLQTTSHTPFGPMVSSHPLLNSTRHAPDKILEEAEYLTQIGSYGAALKRYLWCWNHSLEAYPQWSGVRVSGLLTNWVELGRKYAEAKSAMFEIRDHDARECAEGRGNLALFMDVCSLNNFMKDEDANVALFRQLHEKDAALATECFPSMEDMLVKHRAYSLCLGCLPAPQAAFAGIRHHWEQQRQVEATVATERRDTQKLLDYMRDEHPEWKTLPKTLRPVHPTADKTFIIQTRQLIEILVGVGKISEAESIRDLSNALLPNDGLESAVSDAQKNVGKDT